MLVVVWLLAVCCSLLCDVAVYGVGVVVVVVCGCLLCVFACLFVCVCLFVCLNDCLLACVC